jgi:two-component system OmpR family response regulator/two-component system copper resistance phosphate regulon response regulator CusR
MTTLEQESTTHDWEIKSMEILIVEDEQTLGRAIQRGLTDAGHNCQWAKTGKRGLEEAQSQKYDAIVLDLMLPELSGTEVLKELRTAGIRTPVMILTAKGSVEDRVEGLRDGADDYLVKPFAMTELLARLDAICRRVQLRPSSEITVGPLQLDLTNRRVLREGKEIVLTPTEFTLLEYLMRYAGQVVTRKMLCEHLWEADWEGVTNVVEVHINRLRGKVDRGFAESLIQTVRGRGYVLRAR